MRYFKLSKLFSKLCYEPYKMQFGSSRYHDFHTRESTSKNVEKMESNFSYQCHGFHENPWIHENWKSVYNFLKNRCFSQFFYANSTKNDLLADQIALARIESRPIFRNFKITNIKITKDELFDSIIFKFIFSLFINYLQNLIIFQSLKLRKFINFSNGTISNIGSLLKSVNDSNSENG